MNNIAKGMITVLIILYIISPIDACPGPIDDLIILLIGLAARKRANEMMLGSKDARRIVSCFALPQSCPRFGNHGAPAPLFPHLGAGHKVHHPLACEHAMDLDF